MTSEEANARWVCCPMCDKKKCDREADDCDVKTYLQNKAKSEGVGVTMENAIEYFKSHCKIFCDDYMKKIPKDSIAYQATLQEKEFYDMAIKALEEPSVKDVLGKIRAEIVSTLYVDSLIFGELLDFRDGKIDADDVIEKFNRITRLEVLRILDKCEAEDGTIYRLIDNPLTNEKEWAKVGTTIGYEVV